tara:strand:- start:321 stop:485 length:165 start_codon:yes stop_codon:yes gene_type:complete
MQPTEKQLEEEVKQKVFKEISKSMKRIIREYSTEEYDIMICFTKKGLNVERIYT